MTNNLNNLINEVERLLDLSIVERKLEGVYADNSQLKFLMKKLKSNKPTTSFLNGTTKFVSDFSSSDSKILSLLDDMMEEYCA